MEPGSRHQCIVYGGPPSRHLPALAKVVRQKLGEGYRCLYLNSPPMVAGLQSYLAMAGADVERDAKNGSLILSSEQSHIVNGLFDADKMLHELEMCIEQALKDGYAGLFAAGDMTWELGSDRSIPKLVRYEWKLERLFHKYRALSGICMYHSDTLPLELIKHGAISHGTVFVNETLSLLNPHHVHTSVPRPMVPTLNAEVEEFLSRVLPNTSI
jgi:hypothetical protein